MYIFIMRHGEAANVEGQDALRPLTEHGKLEAEKMGFWLTQYNKPATRLKVFVSPYVRAQQSCNNVLTVVNASDQHENIIPETLNLITPSGDVQQVHDFLDGLNLSNSLDETIGNEVIEGEVIVDEVAKDKPQAILLISHMPFVSYLVGELTNSTNMPIFSTGSIAIIDYNAQTMQGRLVDIMSPDNVDM